MRLVSAEIEDESGDGGRRGWALIGERLGLYSQQNWKGSYSPTKVLITGSVAQRRQEELQSALYRAEITGSTKLTILERLYEDSCYLLSVRRGILQAREDVGRSGGHG